MRYFLIAFLFLASSAFAQTSSSQQDAEQRARDIGAQLRCVVCQNQSIEESDAPLAADMRRLVREQIATGASDEDVISHIRNSYGDYVLLKPPFQTNTYVLWLLPLLLVLICFAWFIRRAPKQTVSVGQTTLSNDDKALLNKLMSDEI